MLICSFVFRACGKAKRAVNWARLKLVEPWIALTKITCLFLSKRPQRKRKNNFLSATFVIHDQAQFLFFVCLFLVRKRRPAHSFLEMLAVFFTLWWLIDNLRMGLRMGLRMDWTDDIAYLGCSYWATSIVIRSYNGWRLLESNVTT